MGVLTLLIVFGALIALVGSAAMRTMSLPLRDGPRMVRRSARRAS